MTENSSTASGSTVPRRQLGRYLRDLRQQAGMTIAEVARLIRRGASSVQRLETGSNERIRLDDVEAICRVIGADETTTEALIGLAQQGNTKSWYHQYGDLIPASFDVYMGLESAAASMTSYLELVPGILQTPEYARALYRAGHPDESDNEIARRVELRIRRQILIKRKTSPVRINAILDETILRRRIGDRRIMSAQLRHLADLSTRENITIRILPHSAGVPLGELTGPFIILDSATEDDGVPLEPSVVYVESYRGALYYEEEVDVRAYRAAHEALGRVALTAQASRDLLRKTAREYARER
ncbi:helix-turn-helix domain-containing protein [Nocardia wallacei]|uniref:Transcriptional regulator n=1 Tax=Nocardia wallacei TaxID=480035 RepID=A0A7G1KEE7_9NOCA|nr:helix-turn-helix transcriptional regulator [Nocardia wallacei]BCK52479.1 transcriptional regulator [Nocardia wallacei]